MRLCTADLKSITPYSQSKMVDQDIIPKRPKETAAEYDLRTWKDKATYTPDDLVAIPAMALKMAIDEAAKRLSIGIAGKGKQTYTKNFKSGQICEMDIPIGVSRDDLQSIRIWANADGRRGSGTRVRRTFPIINEWQGTAQFALLDDEIPNDVFERCLIEAGRLIGIGRFRPENGGMFGRFDVTKSSWQQL